MRPGALRRRLRMLPAAKPRPVFIMAGEDHHGDLIDIKTGKPVEIPVTDAPVYIFNIGMEANA